MKKLYLISFIFVAKIVLATPVWSIVQSGDFHAGLFSTTSSNDFQQFYNFVVTHTNDGIFNIKGVITCGDLYEQNVIPTSQPANINYLEPTNLFNGLTNFTLAGIWVFACNGNHDADDTNSPLSSGSSSCVAGAGWNAWLPVSFFSNQCLTIKGLGFQGTRFANDSRNMAMSYTNGSTRLLMVSEPWPTNNFSPFNIYANCLGDIQYCTNILGQFPDHLGVFCTHHLLNKFNILANWDTGLILYTNIGPGPAILADGLQTCSNLFLCLAGHNRTNLKRSAFFKNKWNNTGNIIEWNSQGFTNYCQMFNLITFDPDNAKVYIRSYNINSGAFMTNGQVSGLNGVGNVSFDHQWTIGLPPANAPLFRIFKIASYTGFFGFVIIVNKIYRRIVHNRARWGLKFCLRKID